MTIATTRVLYTTQARFEEFYAAMLIPVVDRIAGVLNRASGVNGSIPPARHQQVVADAGGILRRLFVGPDLRSAFTTDERPLARYPEVLAHAIAWQTLKILLAHAKQMRTALANEPDILRWLLGESPAGDSKAETINWSDPRGYQLSDRIWQSSVRTGMQFDAMLMDNLRGGMPAPKLAKLMEQFLLPGRAELRTKKPYGSDGSFDTMRLARTEISFHHARMVQRASLANPFVIGIDWALSISHPKFDICDLLATIGMDGSRLKEAYPKDGAPMPIVDSHPQCLCNTRSLTGDIDAVIEDLRAQMFAAARNRFNPDPAPRTPLRLRDLLFEELGEWLVTWLLQNYFKSTPGGIELEDLEEGDW